MAENTKIEWAHHTLNPWIGCTKVSAGCKNCYAETQDNHRKWTSEGWGVGKPRKRTSAGNWRKPLKWNREAEKQGIRYRVFCASLADVFDPEVDDQWRADLLDLVHQTPHLDWLLLTKRPQAAKQFLDENSMRLPSNVWLGTSVEDQEQALARIPILLSILASKHFLSCEPLLGPVDLSLFLHVRHEDEYGNAGIRITNPDQSLSDELDLPFHDPWVKPVDWVIVGGESGSGARPMHPEWATSLRDQCVEAGVAFFFKQWGEWRSATQDDLGTQWKKGHVRQIDHSGRTKGINEAHCPPGDQFMIRAGKKATGRLLDGKAWDEVPVEKCEAPGGAE